MRCISSLQAPGTFLYRGVVDGTPQFIRAKNAATAREYLADVHKVDLSKVTDVEVANTR